jgi:predicted DNA-binding transcriptional regulator YafY
MSDAIYRQWAMLQLLPRRPHKITVRELWEKLANRGFTTTIRTVQRDLQKLAVEFALISDDANPSGWSFDSDSAIHHIPALEPSAALAFKLAEQFLQPLLPPPMLIHLSPYLSRSTEILNEIGNPNLLHWTEQVRVLPRNQPLLPAAVKTEVVRVVYEALLQGKRFRGRYLPKNQVARDYEFNPLGLVFRDSVVYLVSTLWNYADLKQFSLHRFDSAELLEQPRTVPEGFSLDHYIRSGEFDYPAHPNQTLGLKVLFVSSAGSHLYETPLSADQTIVAQDDGRLLVTATVFDTAQLRWWLRGFGDQVEILEPLDLRHEFEVLGQRLTTLYASG